MLWTDVIRKGMVNGIPEFEEALCSIEEALSGKGLPGYQKITCHLIFDAKLDFTRKARFDAGGHLTDPPESITYLSVVSRETVRFAFLVGALNDLRCLCSQY